MALSGLFALGLIGENGLPRYQNQDKRLLALVETDGCAADGISVATDCSVGRRTLRVLDYGKVAATFVDTIGGAAFRASPSPRARARALQYAKGASSPWHAYLEGYQLVPNNELVVIRPVRLTRPISEILSKPGNRVKCSACEEEIMNERETLVDGIIFCRSCAGESYYSAVNST
jgi:formylmethanofuran dehydrogenase subunit E